MRWEVTPILAFTVLTLSLASYRFYSMAKEPDSHWTRPKDAEHEWLKKLEQKAAKKQDEEEK